MRTKSACHISIIPRCYYQRELKNHVCHLEPMRMTSTKYLSIFSPATKEERTKNFANYWQFTQQHGGQLLESDRDLEKKRARLKFFRDHPVRLRQPLADPEAFYRNYVEM